MLQYWPASLNSTLSSKRCLCKMSKIERAWTLWARASVSRFLRSTSASARMLPYSTQEGRTRTLAFPASSSLERDLLRQSITASALILGLLELATSCKATLERQMSRLKSTTSWIVSRLIVWIIIREAQSGLALFKWTKIAYRAPASPHTLWSCSRWPASNTNQAPCTIDRTPCPGRGCSTCERLSSTSVKKWSTQTNGHMVRRTSERERSLRTCYSSTARLTNRFTLMYLVDMTRRPCHRVMQASCQRSVNVPCRRVTIIRPWTWCRMTSPTRMDSVNQWRAAHTTSASTRSSTPIQMEATCLCRKLYRAQERPSIAPTWGETWTTILSLSSQA